MTPEQENEKHRKEMQLNIAKVVREIVVKEHTGDVVSLICIMIMKDGTAVRIPAFNNHTVHSLNSQIDLVKAELLNFVNNYMAVPGGYKFEE